MSKKSKRNSKLSNFWFKKLKNKGLLISRPSLKNLATHVYKYLNNKNKTFGCNESAGNYLVSEYNKIVGKNKKLNGLTLGGCVYFIGNKEHGCVKIGMTTDINKRLSTIQSSCPFELKILGVFQTSSPKNIESVLHKTFRRFKKHGEWFEYSDEIKEYIKNSSKITPLQ